MNKSARRISAGLFLCLLTFAIYAEDTTFISSHFSGSGNCSMCHDGLRDVSGEDVSIVKDWGASMMANATKDPFWRAKVATELERNAHLAPLINDKCTKCHAPMANYEITQVQGGEVTLFGPDGILNPVHDLYDAGMNGVSCTVCHQIEDSGDLGTLAGFSGQYTINNNKTIYGQYSDIFGNPMINHTGYMPTFGAQISDSSLCASCHNLKTPFVDGNGNVLTTTPESGFPEQMPYSEWQHSIFDDDGSNPKSCQDCHMPHTTADVSNRPPWLGSKTGFARHHLVGANTIMLTLLRDNAAQLDVVSNSMDLGINRARAMLQGSVILTIDSASVTDGLLDAVIRLENNSGHKVPSGYPSRRMWLHFKVTDSNNAVVFESGLANADGSITGAAGDADQSKFEPHHELITSEDQVQIYGPVMGDSDGNVTYTLLRGAQYLKDNRLTPKGFDKYVVPDDIAVRGHAANDPDFNQGSDQVTYRFPVAATGELTITVSLNYQTIAHAFLQDLYQDSHLAPVQTFKTMYDAQSLKYEQITSKQVTVISEGGGNPPITPTVSLSASAPVIDAGQSVALNWSSTDTNTCNASWTSRNATSGSQSVSPAVTTTYSISCAGDGGSASDSVTVTVNELTATAPTVVLSASPTSIPRGGSITLSWAATDVNSCTASGLGTWTGQRVSSGSQSVRLDYPVTLTLTCSGDGGSATDSVTYMARGRRWLDQR